MFENFRNEELNLDYIIIETENIKKFAHSLNPEILKIPDWTDNVFLLEGSERDIEFIFFINTINFSYWPDPENKKWTVNFEENNYSGSMALFAAFKKAILAGYPLLEGKYLKDISEDDLKIILAGTVEIPMFTERLNILKTIGENLIENNIANFVSILKQADHSAIKLINIISQLFPSFHDSFIYKSSNFNFFKRAQLICAMLYGRYQGSGLGQFYDIDKLTVFADYRVPQTLRKLGLTTYNKDLNDKIANNIYLSEGSPEELEIRISSVIAGENLKNEINKKYNSRLANSLNLDYFLWTAGKNIIEPDFNFHKTRSTYY